MKIQWHAMPIRALREVAKVFDSGLRKTGPNKKYGLMGWRDMAREDPEGTARKYYDSLMRHVTSASVDDDIDEDSGLYHWAAAAANCIILLDLMLMARAVDERDEDRYCVSYAALRESSIPREYWEDLVGQYVWFPADRDIVGSMGTALPTDVRGWNWHRNFWAPEKGDE